MPSNGKDRLRFICWAMAPLLWELPTPTQCWTPQSAYVFLSGLISAHTQVSRGVLDQAGVIILFGRKVGDLKIRT